MPPLWRCEFLKSRTHGLILYSKLHRLSCSSALPESTSGVVYISSQISPICRMGQHQNWINHCFNILKFNWKKFDSKLPLYFREMLKNVTLKVKHSFGPFYNAYRTREYFLTAQVIENSLPLWFSTHWGYFSQKFGFAACSVEVWQLKKIL